MSNLNFKEMNQKIEQSHQKFSQLIYKLNPQNLEQEDIKKLLASYDYILRNHLLFTSANSNEISINEHLSYLSSNVNFAFDTIDEIYNKYQQLYPSVM